MIDHNVTTITRALGGDAPERGMSGLLAGSVSDSENETGK
jgi:manganese/zinc/iron transport system substrate-binding protein